MKRGGFRGNAPGRDITRSVNLLCEQAEPGGTGFAPRGFAARLAGEVARHPVMWAISLLSVLIPVALKNGYYADIAVMSFLWGGLGCAWNLYSGYAKRVSIGHAAFVGIGAYTSVLLFQNFGVSPWIGGVAGAALSAGVALIVGGATLRLRGTFFVLSTIAFAKIFEVAAVAAKELTGGSQGRLVPFDPGFANMIFETKRGYAGLCWLYMLAALLLCVALENSRFGLLLRATGEDREAAESLGVDSSGTLLAAFAASAALTSFGGTLYAQYFLFIEPSGVMGLAVSVNLILIVIAGGQGTAFGPVFGAFALTPISHLLRGAFGDVSGLHGLLVGVILLLVLLRRPDGVLPQLRRFSAWARGRFFGADGAAHGETTGEKGGADAPEKEAGAGLERRADGMRPPLLEIHGAEKRFGGIEALRGVDLTVGCGEIVGLIGPNGSGKTTLFNCVHGIVSPSAGRMFFEGRDITGLRTWRLARRGIARSYQAVRPMGGMTVFENVTVGGFCGTKNRAEAERRAMRALETVGLAHRRDEPARALNLGERKKLEIAKALATAPKLLLLDEVMAGLTPAEVGEAVALVRAINRAGVSVLITEHITEAVMPLCDRIAVLDFGTKIGDGSPADIAASAAVAAAYLGVPDAADAMAHPDAQGAKGETDAQD